MESQTPAAPSTDHTISTETTVTTPKAIESRNAVFITDHGSTRVSRRRARRGGRLDAARGRAASLARGRCWVVRRGRWPRAGRGPWQHGTGVARPGSGRRAPAAESAAAVDAWRGGPCRRRVRLALRGPLGLRAGLTCCWEPPRRGSGEARLGGLGPVTAGRCVRGCGSWARRARSAGRVSPGRPVRSAGSVGARRSSGLTLRVARRVGRVTSAVSSIVASGGRIRRLRDPTPPIAPQPRRPSASRPWSVRLARPRTTVLDQPLAPRPSA